METLTLEESMEKYPYLKRMSEYTIFTTSDDIKNLKNGEKVQIGDIEISTEYLKRILQDEKYYNYAYHFFTNKASSFSVCYIIGGDTSGSISYKKSQIMKGIEKLISDGKIQLQPVEQERYENLKESISFEKFLKQNKENNYSILIDGNQYSIPAFQLISFMQLSEEVFHQICSNPDIQMIYDIPKEHFIYASYQFFKKNKVFEEFMIPSEIENRFSDIQSFQAIDLQAINAYLETEDTKFKEATLNPELEREILSGMPEDATELEKAIYIYIKMCKLLTYDEEYYAVNQKGKATLKHKDIQYISSINLQNNKVVCFEFNLIYSILLDQLGIKFRSDYKNMAEEFYGEAHANLEFRSGKYLVIADSVTSILGGDMTNAKLNQPLIGLQCMNRNTNTQLEFRNAVSKMYELIIQQENNFSEKPNVRCVQTFEEIMDEYKSVTTNLNEVGFDEKLSILIEKVNATQMVGIDSLSYVLQLRKVLFNEEERQNHLGLTIIRNNEAFASNGSIMASAIFTLNQTGFKENEEQNLYYYFEPNQELVLISKEELQKKFNDGLFEYIEKEDPRIPGIMEVGGNVK